MGDTMRPIERVKGKDYFWFDPPQQHILPNGQPAHWEDGGMEKFHPSLGYRANHASKKLLQVYPPFGDSISFDLSRFPADTWENLSDNSGDPIPLRVYVHGGRVAGQWLPDPGIAPPPPATARPASTKPGGVPPPPTSLGDSPGLQQWLTNMAQMRPEMRKAVAENLRESGPTVSPQSAEPLPEPAEPTESSKPTTERLKNGPNLPPTQLHRTPFPTLAKPEAMLLEGIVATAKLGGYSLTYYSSKQVQELMVDVPRANPKIGGSYRVGNLPIREWFVLTDRHGSLLPVAVQKIRENAYHVRVDSAPLQGLRAITSTPGY